MKMQWDLLMNGTLQKFKGEETKQKEATNSSKKKTPKVNVTFVLSFQSSIDKKVICLKNCFVPRVLATKFVIVLI